MESLPLEILHHIFLLACSDGGRTGLALSLTSKTYRDITRPARYNSVAIFGYNSITAFLKCHRLDRTALEAVTQTQESAPIVRHLPLTTDAADLRRTSRPGGIGDLPANLRDIFQLVGPTLVTLSYTCHAQLEVLLADCAFPRLEELTFLRNWNMPCRFPPAFAYSPAYPELPRTLPSLPSLRRLHVILTSTYDHGVPIILARWAHAAPNVTHLRISNLRGSMGGLEWLKNMLHKSREERPYPSVAHIVVQPYARPVPASYGGGMTHETYDEFIAQLYTHQQNAQADVSLVWLEPRGWSGMLLRDWREGVDGGEGSWPEGKTS